MANESDLSDQVLSKAAEMGLESQLDEAEDLDVDVHANPVQVIQGDLESVEIEGEGLVMETDLRTESLEIKTSEISINPFKAALGDIEMEHPTDAITHVVLNESDFERALNSDYIRSKLQNLTIHLDGQPVPIKTRHITFQLPGDRTVKLEADVEQVDTGDVHHVCFTAVPKASPDGHQVLLEDVQYPNDATAPELTDALLDAAQTLLNLRNFELEGMTLQLESLDLQQGKMILDATTRVLEFPGE